MRDLTVRGGSALELAENVKARAKEMEGQGTLQKLESREASDTYIYKPTSQVDKPTDQVDKPTDQVVRIGRTNSEEMSATVSYSNFRGRGKGAQLDLEQSLYMPKSKGPDPNRSSGFGVLVMERVPGTSLKSSALAKAEGELSPDELAQLKQVPGKVADAVVDMHMHRRAHGDLDKSNVILDKATGEVRVIDFGSSRRTTDRGRREQDVYGLAYLIKEFGHKTSEPLMTQAKAMYLQALDRYAGPDRDAPVYKDHPKLYEPHLKRFNERKAALRSEMAE